MLRTMKNQPQIFLVCNFALISAYFESEVRLSYNIFLIEIKSVRILRLQPSHLLEHIILNENQDMTELSASHLD